jgi:hypothetical protein
MLRLKTFTYSPGKIFLLVGGAPVFTFNEVTVQYHRPRWRMIEGTRGEVTRGRSYTSVGSIFITIPRTSPFNDMLTIFYGAHNVIPVIIKDLLGASLHAMLRGTIITAPDTSYKKGVTDLVWEIQGTIDINVVGGSYV